MTSEGTATEATNSDEKNMEVDPTPQKETNEVFSCEICNLTFTNNCILDSHLAGKRHLKILRSKNLGGLVKDSANLLGNSTSTNVIGQFYCNDCGIYANSSNQLDMHMKSNKHIAKVEKNKVTGETKATPKILIGTKKKAGSENVKDATPVKKTKAAGPPEIFKCTICNVEMNSKTQFEQHLASNKHKNRENPKSVPKSNKLSSAKRKGAAYMAKKREARFGLGYDRPLSQSFISAGTYQENSVSSDTSSYPSSALYTSRNKSTYGQQSSDYSNYDLSTSSFNSSSKFNGENFQYGRSSLSTYGTGSYSGLSALSKSYSKPYSLNSQSLTSQYNSSYYQYNPSQQPPKPGFSLW